MHEEILRQEFNQWAAAGRGSSMERGHRPTGEQAIELMDLRADSRVLDLGCGNGWASRTIAAKTPRGRVQGIDVSDQMVSQARAESAGFTNVEFQVASAEDLPFANGAFSHAFSMESIYYYGDMKRALAEVRRVLEPNGLFVAVVDLYRENAPSLYWVEQLQVPVHALSIEQYRELLTSAGFVGIEDRRLLDPTPAPAEFSSQYFRSAEEFARYRENGSLMLSGRAAS